jgi:hypothetical protein
VVQVQAQVQNELEHELWEWVPVVLVVLVAELAQLGQEVHLPFLMEAGPEREAWGEAGQPSVYVQLGLAWVRVLVLVEGL